jgi:signal transduction histidine kinase
MGAEFHIQTPAARKHARRMASLLKPAAVRLQREFARILRGRNYSPEAVSAMLAITPAAAADCRSSAIFLARVEHNGRRLAKLNVAPGEIYDALQDFAALAKPVLKDQCQPAREQLDLATRLTINQAYYHVREAETQAHFGIYRAEIEATDLEDFLHRLVRVLTSTLGARAGRIVPLPEGFDPALAEPHYIERGSGSEHLIFDEKMRRRYPSFWTFPLGATHVAQFGFAAKHQWLPRELALLESVGERCRIAEERRRLEAENLRLEAEARRAEEDERRRIGRELHDEAGQSLLLLRLQLEMMEREAPPELREPLGASRRVAESTIEEIRRIVAALSPQLLERLGLPAALRHLGGRFLKMHPAGLDMRMPKSLPPIPTPVAEAVYRVTQESLMNIAKHSSATLVKFSFRIADSQIKLSVSDNGSGFGGEDAVRNPLSFGLVGMRERAALLGGKLEAASAPGKGVTVKLELPLGVTPNQTNG